MKSQFQDFELDSANRVLRRQGEPLPLPAKAFDVLCFLFENRGRLVGKNEIIDAVWEGQAIEEANLTVQISHIRKVLGDDPRSPKLIETVPRFGYRFNLSENPDSVFVETYERIVIEHRESGGGMRPGVLVAAGATAALLTVAFVGYLIWPRPGATVGQAMQLSRLTNNGRVGVSAVSRDGRLVAYSMREDQGTAIWIRQAGIANDRRIVDARPGEIWSVTFDPAGTELYYVRFSSDRVDPELRRVPALGGLESTLPGVFAHSISFAPDGERFAYVLPNSAANENYVVVQDRNGTGKRTVGTKPQPSTYIYDGHYAAWSPDGRSIAVVVNRFENESNHNSIIAIDPESGTETAIGAYQWHNVRSIEWVSEGDGILISASRSTAGRNRLWFLPRDGSEPRPITEDLAEYDSISSGGPGSFTARQTTTTATITLSAEDNRLRELFSEVGSLVPVRWTPSGRIVFRSSADGTPNIWIADADGTNRRQLTVNAEADERGLCVTADDRFAVYVSWQSGRSNLWRVALDGSGRSRLSDGDADAFPVCSPDGRTVIFQRGLISQPSLWTVPIDGGEAVRLTAHRAKWGALSSDGVKLAFFRMRNDRWQIGFAGLDGDLLEPGLDVPKVFRGNRIRWSKDDREFYFAGSDGVSDDVWKIPVEGGSPLRLTNFGNGSVLDFDVDADRSFVVARSQSTSDVVRFSQP